MGLRVRDMNGLRDDLHDGMMPAPITGVMRRMSHAGKDLPPSSPGFRAD